MSLSGNVGMPENVAMADVASAYDSLASRFFAGPKSGINYTYSSCIVNLSPSPTKLLPKPEEYDAGIVIELSVVLHDKRTPPKWNEGCVPCGRKVPFGCIDFDLHDAISLGLSCELDPKDWSPSHANIRGWPDDDDGQMEIAIMLARKSSLIINDNSTGHLLSFCAREYLTHVQPARLEYNALKLLVYAVDTQ